MNIYDRLKACPPSTNLPKATTAKTSPQRNLLTAVGNGNSPATRRVSTGNFSTRMGVA